MSRIRRAGTALLALGACAAAQGVAPAVASVSIGSRRIVVSGPGARVVVDRDPLRISFQDAAGTTVLRELAGGARPTVQPLATRPLYGAIGAPAPTRYGPLGFLVGTQTIAQADGGQWVANLRSLSEGGTRYAARRVRSARRKGRGVRLELETDDPSGRWIAATIAVVRTGAVGVHATVSDGAGVAAMTDSFTSAAGEEFHGFGGRHDRLDQRGRELLGWVAQENVGSGSTRTITPPRSGGRYLFPNGPAAAYYVQSSFVSSAGYGFLLDRDELSQWRMASDRPDAWQVQASGPALDYVVAIGRPARAIGTLTAISGRHRLPPAWALGSTLDRLTTVPAPTPARYLAEVRADLRNLRRWRIPVTAYRIEGWELLPRRTLRAVIAELRARGVHTMLYLRGFVGAEAGTDSTAAYREALARGYVATRADGTPYLFKSNFNAPGAQIDFTNPVAVRWWQARVRAALDLGADGFMEDFGEQVQVDMRFHDGRSGAELHNALPVLYHRATRAAIDAWRQAHRGREPFTFVRSGYSGTPGSTAYEQAAFPGDETTDWSRSSGLASQAPDMLNRAIGGAYGFTTDIGGYYDVPPFELPTSRELFLRWAQWAALSPFFRLHGSVLSGTHTPWSYGPGMVRAYRALARLHARAVPLILRLWRSARRTGMPPTRPLWLAAPGDHRAAAQDQEWLLGPDLLVAPVVVEGARSRSVHLPRGCWRRNGTGPALRGPRTLRAAAPLAQLPWFARCGTRPLA